MLLCSSKSAPLSRFMPFSSPANEGSCGKLYLHCLALIFQIVILKPSLRSPKALLVFHFLSNSFKRSSLCLKYEVIRKGWAPSGARQDPEARPLVSAGELSLGHPQAPGCHLALQQADLEARPPRRAPPPQRPGSGLADRSCSARNGGPRGQG